MKITQAEIKYYGTLAEMWNGSKFVLFSFFLSAVVAAWDVNFVLDHFTANKFLAIMMMLAVHLSYVVLPYMQEPEPTLTKAEKKKWRNKLPSFNQVMIVIFFTASMTPAALQISGQFLDKMINAVKVEPTKPDKPEYDSKLDKDIDIYRYRIWKEIDLAESQEKLKELEAVKSDFRLRMADYEKNVAEYPKKLEAYLEFKAKGRLTWFFDVAMLMIGFVSMISLQVMSGYSSKRGSKEKLANVNKPEPPTEPASEPEPEKQPEPGIERPY